MPTGHGIYTLAVGPRPQSAGADGPEHATDARRPPCGVARRTAPVADRLAGVTRDFAACVEAYDRHRMAVEARLRCGSVREALDETFPRLLYGTLQRWGIGRRASVLVPLAEFRQRLRDQAAPITALQDAAIDDHALDIPAVCDQVWRVIENLCIVHNRSVIVPGT